jgi:hypothetical protein
VAYARRRSPPRRPSDIRCRRRGACRGGIPAACDGPTEVFVPTAPREESRFPEDQDVFHRHVTRRSRTRKDCSFRPSRRLSRSRRPHFGPRVGDSAVDGHCEITVAVTRLSVNREYRHLFYSLELPRLGLTTQARHRARPTRPSTRTDCLARTDADRSA